MEDFNIIKQLGQGIFGKALLVQNKSNDTICVVKQIQPNIEIRRRVIQEIMIIQSLNHQNIIKFHNYVEEDKSVLIFMEFAQGGCLKQSQIIEEFKLKIYLVQILLALHYMHHEKHIIHRDIKPDNILIHNGVIKLCDFGFSKELDSTWEFANSVLGTPVYCAPEVANRKSYTNKCDIWSLGIVLYQMLTGELPFQAKSIKQLLTKINNGKYKQVNGTYSKQLLELLSQMLQVNPEQRPGVQSILESGIFNTELLYLQRQYVKQGQEEYLDQIRQFIKD